MESGVSNADIEQLIAAWLTARKAKDFARADAIRAELWRQGIVLEDGPLRNDLAPGVSPADFEP